ncbi:kinase-like domain-containing protein [Mycena alexandri]|uniref:Kinase-like domain-containing protein n=1 Tax=Mycena alexandri TaxID=1745969 RepID=A0AAD6WVH6_9AGAR|nr:kinase-like domain-containing protein [Mycena alexandri]
MPVPIPRPVLTEAQAKELSLALREISPDCSKFHLIGTTPYGKVYRVHHKTLNRIVALKIVECEKTEDGVSTNVYNSSEDGPPKDFTILESLTHPHVLRILSTYRGGTGFSTNIFSEFVAGGTLFDYGQRELRSQRLLGGATCRAGVSEIACRDIIYQLCQAMAYVHRQGIVHRNLKLDNIFLSGDAPFIKVAGFGLATHVPPTSLLSEIRGSMEYMAPEMMSIGEPGYNCMADVWAVGIMMFELLILDNPYKSPRTYPEYTPPKLRWDLFLEEGRHLSDEGVEFLAGFLSVDPETRFSIQGALEHPWLMYHRPMYPNVVYP